MMNKPPIVPSDRVVSAYANAQNSYGEIEVGLDRFTRRLESILESQLSQTPQSSSPVEVLKRLHTSDIYLTVGCALPTESAWRKFIECFRPLIHGVAYYASGDSERAWELTVDVLAHLYMPNRAGLSRIASFDGRW